MGRDQVDLRIQFFVSRHNSPQDAIDDAAVEDFFAAVGALLCDPRYAGLSVYSEGCTETYRDMSVAQSARVQSMLLKAYERARDGRF
jgi:hypothetical protein